VEIAGGVTGSQGAVLCGEQEFLADLKREGYTCEMLILPNRIRRLAFFAVFCVAWFNAAVGRPVEALSAVKKTVLVLHGDRLSILAVKTTEQGLMAGPSRGQPEEVGIFSEYLDLSRFPAAQYGDDLVRYLRAQLDGSAYLQACLASHLPVDLVVIMLGSNDL
jgi:hypothetical protein